MVNFNELTKKKNSDIYKQYNIMYRLYMVYTLITI